MHLYPINSVVTSPREALCCPHDLSHCTRTFSDEYSSRLHSSCDRPSTYRAHHHVSWSEALMLLVHLRATNCSRDISRSFNHACMPSKVIITTRATAPAPPRGLNPDLYGACCECEVSPAQPIIQPLPGFTYTALIPSLVTTLLFAFTWAAEHLDHVLRLPRVPPRPLAGHTLLAR